MPTVTVTAVTTGFHMEGGLATAPGATVTQYQALYEGNSEATSTPTAGMWGYEQYAALALPQGSGIISAPWKPYLYAGTFQSGGGKGPDTNLDHILDATWYCHAVDSSNLAFAADAVKNAPRTAAHTRVTATRIGPGTDVSTAQRATTGVDIATALQEVVARSGWVSGNAFGLIWQDAITAATFASSRVPSLAIEDNSTQQSQIVVTYDAAPTIAYGASSLADGTTTHSATPTLTAYVTDSDTGQTETVTFEVATDAAFANIVYSGTATTASPSASAAVSKVVGVTLVKDATYYWRARVSDGTLTSANTTTRTFYVNRTPTATNPGTNPSGFVAVGGGSQTIAWTYADADGDVQVKYYLRRVLNGVTTYWTGAAWQSTEVAVVSAAASVSPTFAANSHQYVVSVAVEDGSAAKSAYTQVAAFTVYTPPTATIGASTPAAVVSAGGPTLNVGWTYAQAEGYAQATYRVQVQNAAGSVTYYDSGVLSGTAASLAIDAVANDIPVDTTASALKVIVTLTCATAGASVAANKAFDIQWGVVTCSITNPTAGQILGVSSVTATWSFASTRGFTQSKYRVRLMLNSTGAVLYDSGFVASTAASLAVPVVLVDGTYYSLEVTLQNTMGVTN